MPNRITQQRIDRVKRRLVIVRGTLEDRPHPNSYKYRLNMADWIDWALDHGSVTSKCKAAMIVESVSE